MDSASNQLVSTVQTYRQGGLRTYWPGPLGATDTTTTYRAHCKFWDRHFSISRSSLDEFILALQTNSTPLSATEIPEEVRIWPGKSNPFLKQMAIDSGLTNLSAFDQDLAPFIDVDGNGLYEPQLGDYPDLGQKSSMVWWVMNDGGNTKIITPNLDTVMTANLEFQVMAFGFPRLLNQHFLDNTLFLDWKMINKGDKKLKNSYLSIWSDVDLGNLNNDRLLCHPMKNLGIGYNSDSIDPGIHGHGANPPAIAYKVLDAPGPIADQDGHDNNRNGIVDEEGEKATFSGFVNYYFYPNPQSGNPSMPKNFYRLQQMLWNDSTHVTFGGNGTSTSNVPTKFMFPGNNDPYGFSIGGTVYNPIINPGLWTEESAQLPPGDRRMVLNSGPFTFAPGQSISYKYAIIIGHGSSVNHNLNQLYATSDSLEQILPVITQTTKPFSNPAPKIRVFPNPANHQFTIHGTEAGTQLEIINMSGQKVLSKVLGSSEALISIRNFPGGMYALKFQLGRSIIVQKFLVE